MDIRSVREELAAFADDDEALVLDDSGELVMHRGGIEIEARISFPVGSSPIVHMGDQTISYRNFLTRHLGQLDVLASKLIEKRPNVPAFIDASASADSADGEFQHDSALSLLQSQCAEEQGFRSRVCFLTADAGQGKTALLREFQAQTAEAFLEGTSPFLFWYVDLQGRQLLRLSEALMGDLADLRLAGLWMPAILKLIRYRALVLAIDGFDELAAEQGGSDALGSLATLVQQLHGQGVVVAASRRAFFDTGDYLRRAGMFGRFVAEPCEFNQITLADWKPVEAVSYLSTVVEEGRTFAAPKNTYEEIVQCLGGSADHPMVAKPFLLAHVARGLLRYEITPGEFIRPPGDDMEGVAAVVEAFVSREVADKWIYRESGEPYLTQEQHMRLLADVAEEMYRAGKDRLPFEIVETLAAMRLDEWNIDPERQRQVMEMVRMHALLRPTTDSDTHSDRSFDHPEFKDYFLAVALRNHLEDAANEGNVSGLADYLSIAQLSDSSARYVRGMMASGLDLASVAVALAQAATRQIRSTFLQVNAGTLIPALLDGLPMSSGQVEVIGNAVYSSLVFEESQISGVKFSGSTFLNVSLRKTNWTNVTLDACELGELSIHADTDATGVTIRNCKIDGVRLFRDGSETERAYAPPRVRSLLSAVGFRFEDQLGLDETLPDSDEVILARRLLQFFSRSNVVTDDVIERRLGPDARWVISDLIPVFEVNGVLKEKTWRGAGLKRIWSLGYPLELVLKAETESTGSLATLWEDLHATQRD